MTLNQKLRRLKEEFSSKHFLGLIATVVAGLYIENLAGWLDVDRVSPIDRYGFWFAITLYYLRVITLLIIAPTELFSAFTTLFVDDKKSLQFVKTPTPTICFRVVTRGMFPELVKDNLKENLSLLKPFESLEYTYEVVTDNHIGIEDLKIPRCYEVLVPTNYATPRGTLFKARALQYAIEYNVSNLKDEDWVVHLDEETILTESSIRGVFKFVNNGKHQIGQGTIVYGKLAVENTFNTLIDCMRVAQDLGSLRAALKYFNRPIYFFKGSFVCAQHRAEKEVTFDNGPDGSITEDSYFALKAVGQGFTFDWIEGEMREKSPFTFMDILRQRKRWYQGVYLVLKSKEIHTNVTKLIYTWEFIKYLITPLSFVVFVVCIFYPVSFPQNYVYVEKTFQKITLYMYLVGYFNCWDFGKINWFKRLVFMMVAPIFLRASDLIESIGIIWAMATPKKGFAVVKKSFERSKLD